MSEQHQILQNESFELYIPRKPESFNLDPTTTLPERGRLHVRLEDDSLGCWSCDNKDLGPFHPTDELVANATVWLATCKQCGYGTRAVLGT